MSMTHQTKLLPFIRLAVESDRYALTAFYSSVFGDTENVSSAYADIALSSGRTYVFDVSKTETFIASALTIIPTEFEEKYIAFGGTIPPLRNRGIFTELLSAAIDSEREKDGVDKLIFLNPSIKNRHFLQKQGFTHEAFALECFINGNTQKNPKFIRGVYGGSTYHFLRCKHLGEDGLSETAFSNIYSYYLSKGNQIAIMGDGYIAFSPFEDEKGKYIIDECALTVDSILKLPPAFEKCLIPIQKEAEIKKLGITYNVKCTAVANFEINGRYINGLFK
jgi:hypothetical protein